MIRELAFPGKSTPDALVHILESGMERSHTLDVGEPDAFDLLFFIRRRATRLPMRVANFLESVSMTLEMLS